MGYDKLDYATMGYCEVNTSSNGERKLKILSSGSPLSVATSNRVQIPSQPMRL